jgi:uncharacterized protein (DUF2147 family)/fucose 4-O-acetylase-like acetyltransferase
MTDPSSFRRNDIDALRILATYLLFVFHAAMVFNPAPFYHVRNAEQSFFVLVLAGFISLWHMPLFFVLAGWTLCTNLSARGGSEVLRERARRLLVPLVAGCLLFGPTIKYLELSSGLDLNHRGLKVAAELKESFRSVVPIELETAPPFHESFLEFLPSYFSQLERFTWSHLWFLAYLFVLTMALLPVLAPLARRVSAAGAASSATVYLPLVPLATIQVGLRPYWPGIQNLYDDWANVAYYATFLVTGFFLARSERFERTVAAEGRRAFLISLGTLGFLLLGVLGVVRSQAAVLAATAVAGWCTIVALLAAGQRWLRAGLPAMEYLRESALPVYILHQPAIVLLGYAIVRTDLGIFTKLALLLASSVALTMVVYHVLVRPNPMVRPLFGMRRKGPARPRAATYAAAAAVVVLWFAFAGEVGSRMATYDLPYGVWWAEGGAAQVEIKDCGESLCGEIVWLRSPFDEAGCPLRDASNPDPTRRNGSILGLQLLEGMKLAQPGGIAWAGGTIYDPTSGRTYRATVTMDGPNRLRLRGYVGVPLLGRTTTWIRVGAEPTVCAEAMR